MSIVAARRVVLARFAESGKGKTLGWRVPIARNGAHIDVV
jgi:hypothetical protein